jgi:lauroyl/myristoyl acyltransferase
MALYLVIQVSAFLSKIVPRRLRYFVGSAVGDAVYLVWARKRRVLLENMAVVTGLSPRDPYVRRIALRSMRNYCKYLVEFLGLPALSSAHEVIASMKISGIEHLQTALDKGKGVIIATAHFGTIEIPGLRLQNFTEFHAVYDSFRPGYLDRLIQRKRREKGIDLIPATSVRAMLRVLSSGGALCTLFDRPVEGVGGVPVTFFGRPTAVPGGPALLALKTGATLLPVYTRRQPDLTFASEIFPPVTCAETGDRDSDIRNIMQKLMNTLQIAVRERPDQWYMFRPMWGTKAGEVQAVTRESQADSSV